MAREYVDKQKRKNDSLFGVVNELAMIGDDSAFIRVQ